MFQISVVSPAQALVNGQPGNSLSARVILEAEGSSGGDCGPEEPPSSVPPFTCVVAMFPPVPEVDIKDVFSAEPTYLLQKGS